MSLPKVLVPRVTRVGLAALVSVVIGLVGVGQTQPLSAAAHPSAHRSAGLTAAGAGHSSAAVHSASATKKPLIAYFAQTGTIFDYSLFVTDLTGTTRRPLTDVGLDAILRWGPFGGNILYNPDSGEDLWLIRPDGRRNRLLHTFPDRAILDMAWAPGAGRIALVMSVPNDDPDLFIYTPRTNSLRLLHLSSPHRSPRSVDWSHDGRRLAFSAIDRVYMGHRIGNVYTVAPDGSALEQVTHSRRLDETHPRWSPDDSRLLFVRAKPNDKDPGRNCRYFNDWIVNAAADGTDQKRVRGACDSFDASWAPHGRRVVVEKQTTGPLGLWTMNLDGTKRRFIAQGRQAGYRPLP